MRMVYASTWLLDLEDADWLGPFPGYHAFGAVEDMAREPTSGILGTTQGIWSHSLMWIVFKELLQFNNIPGITINVRLPGKSYSKMYGAEPRFNDGDFVPRTQNLSRYNDKINMTDHKKCSIFLFSLHLPYPLCFLISSLVWMSFKASCVEKCMYKFTG